MGEKNYIDVIVAFCAILALCLSLYNTFSEKPKNPILMIRTDNEDNIMKNSVRLYIQNVGYGSCLDTTLRVPALIDRINLIVEGDGIQDYKLENAILTGTSSTHIELTPTCHSEFAPLDCIYHLGILYAEETFSLVLHSNSDEKGDIEIDVKCSDEHEILNLKKQ